MMTRQQFRILYPDFDIIDFESRASGVWATAKLARDPSDIPSCPQCGKTAIRHASTHPTVHDRIKGHNLILAIIQRRWRCREHGTWLEDLPFRSTIHPKLSTRLEAEILARLEAGEIAGEIAEDTGISLSLVGKMRARAGLPGARPWAGRKTSIGEQA